MLVDLNLKRMEKTLILEALKRTNWVQRKAAVLLGVSARCLNWKIQRLGIVYDGWHGRKPERVRR